MILKVISSMTSLITPDRKLTSHWRGRGDSVLVIVLPASEVVCVRAAPLNSSALCDPFRRVNAHSSAEAPLPPRL